jgi:O-antigen/teichoic acid export membrane protein
MVSVPSWIIANPVLAIIHDVDFRRRIQKYRSLKIKSLGPVFRNLTATSIVSMAEYVTQAALVLVLPWALAPQTYGMYRQVMAYAAVAGFFHFGLLNGYYSRICAERGDEIGSEQNRAVRHLLLLITTITGAVCLGIVWLIVKDWQERLVAVMVVITIGLINLQTFHQYTWLGRSIMRPYVIISLITKVILMGSVLSVFKLNGSPPVLIIAVLLAPLLVNVASYEGVWRACTSGTATPNLRMSIADLRAGWPIFQNTALIAFASGFDKILLGTVVPHAAFASYALAFTVSGFFAIAADAVSNAITPLLTGSKAAETETRIINEVQMLVIWLAGGAFFATGIAIDQFFPSYSGAKRFIFIAGLHAPVVVFLKAYITPQFLIDGSLRPARTVVRAGAATIIAGSMVVWATTQSLVVTASLWLLLLLAMTVAMAFCLPENPSSTTTRRWPIINLALCLAAVSLTAQVASPLIGFGYYALVAVLYHGVRFTVRG